MIYNYHKNIHFLVGIILSLALVLYIAALGWAGDRSNSRHVTVIYSGNTSGLTEPTG